MTFGKRCGSLGSLQKNRFLFVQFVTAVVAAVMSVGEGRGGGGGGVIYSILIIFYYTPFLHPD